MKEDEILKRHHQYKDKNMEELISERHAKQLKNQNKLRKKYLPEKYNPKIDK